MGEKLLHRNLSKIHLLFIRQFEKYTFYRVHIVVIKFLDAECDEKEFYGVHTLARCELYFWVIRYVRQTHFLFRRISSLKEKFTLVIHVPIFLSIPYSFILSSPATQH